MVMGVERKRRALEQAGRTVRWNPRHTPVRVSLFAMCVGVILLLESMDMAAAAVVCRDIYNFDRTRMGPNATEQIAGGSHFLFALFVTGHSYIRCEMRFGSRAKDEWNKYSLGYAGFFLNTCQSRCHILCSRHKT